MNRNAGKLLVATTIALFGISLSTDAFADFTIKRIVRCDKGMDVQDILDRNIFGLPMEIRLVGPCDGFEIEQDDVEITALHDHSCPGATVAGGIILNGAHRVDIRCIAVTSGDEGAGIALYSSSATIEAVDIWGIDDIALGIGGGSYAEVMESTIRDSGEGVSIERSNASFDETIVTGHSGIGVNVEHNSSLEFIGGSISDNAENGVSATNNSALILDDVVVSNNGGFGVALYNGAAAGLDEVTIRDNVRSGIYGRRQVSLNILGGSITNNAAGVILNQHSMMFVSRTRIENNQYSGLLLRYDSGALLWDGTYLLGNLGAADVVCEGEESSIQIHGGAVIGSVDCPHPDF